MFGYHLSIPVLGDSQCPLKFECHRFNKTAVSLRHSVSLFAEFISAWSPIQLCSSHINVTNKLSLFANVWKTDIYIWIPFFFILVLCFLSHMFVFIALASRFCPVCSSSPIERGDWRAWYTKGTHCSDRPCSPSLFWVEQAHPGHSLLGPILTPGTSCVAVMTGFNKFNKLPLINCHILTICILRL